MTKASAVELASDKNRVNDLSTGRISLPMEVDPNRPGDFAKSQPWPEYGDSYHIASTALFFASDESEFITGESIIVDGGLTAAGPERKKVS